MGEMPNFSEGEPLLSARIGARRFSLNYLAMLIPASSFEFFEVHGAGDQFQASLI